MEIPNDDVKRDLAEERDRLLAYFEARPGRPIQPWIRDELYDDDEDAQE